MYPLTGALNVTLNVTLNVALNVTLNVTLNVALNVTLFKRHPQKAGAWGLPAAAEAAKEAEEEA